MGKCFGVWGNEGICGEAGWVWGKVRGDVGV